MNVAQIVDLIERRIAHLEERLSCPITDDNQHYLFAFSREQFSLSNLLRCIQNGSLTDWQVKWNPEWPDKPIKPGDDVYTVEEFRNLMLDHSFVNDDGSGYFATREFYGKIEVFSVPFDQWPIWATHVVWYNK